MWEHFGWNKSVEGEKLKIKEWIHWKTPIKNQLTVDIKESSTDTAKAVPQAKGWVRYNSVSGSSSSSWSKNCTLLSLTSSGK